MYTVTCSHTSHPVRIAAYNTHKGCPRRGSYPNAHLVVTHKGELVGVLVSGDPPQLEGGKERFHWINPCLRSYHFPIEPLMLRPEKFVPLLRLRFTPGRRWLPPPDRLRSTHPREAEMSQSVPPCVCMTQALLLPLVVVAQCLCAITYRRLHRVSLQTWPRPLPILSPVSPCICLYAVLLLLGVQPPPACTCPPSLPA